MTGFHLRELDPTRLSGDDVIALAGLAETVRDGGRVGFTTRPLLPLAAYYRLWRHDAVGILAREREGGRVAGVAFISYGTATHGGRPVRYALLNGLQVHPEFRRRGVASELTAWRLAHVETAAAASPHLTWRVIATIQTGNAASLANARRWGSVVGLPLQVTPVPVRRTRPRRRWGWSVREATADDLAVVADGLTEQRSGFALAPATGPDDLRRWLGRQLDGVPLNRYWVLADRTGTPLAGLGVHDEPRYAELAVSGLSTPMRWAGRVTGVVPGDGVMRNLQAVLPWQAPGAENAARQLWQEIRYLERHSGTAIVTTLDPRHPSRPALAAPRWLPSTSIHLVTRPVGSSVEDDGVLELPT